MGLALHVYAPLRGELDILMNSSSSSSSASSSFYLLPRSPPANVRIRRRKERSKEKEEIEYEQQRHKHRRTRAADLSNESFPNAKGVHSLARGSSDTLAVKYVRHLCVNATKTSPYFVDSRCTSSYSANLYTTVQATCTYWFSLLFFLLHRPRSETFGYSLVDDPQSTEII